MRLHVRYIDEPALQDRRAVHVAASERVRKPALPGFRALGIALGDGDRPHLIAVGQCDGDRGVGKQFHPALHDGVEHRLRVGERIADHGEDF